MIVALAGNQNCGKTTLFNQLTGSGRHVGNWPGVTVEKAEDRLLSKWQKGFSRPVRLVDLPGVYSLAPFTGDEAVTRHFLLHTPPDVILNVVDATHLERNLYLTLQLLSLRLPMVIALTMVDSLAAAGGRVDAAALSKRLGVPVVPVCAAKQQGLENLLHALRAALPPKRQLRLGGEAGRALEQLAVLLPDAPPLLAAALPEGRHALPETHPARAVLHRLEAATGLPPAEAVAVQCYRQLEDIAAQCFTPGQKPPAAAGLERLLVSSSAALPIFFCVLAAVFWLAFGAPGALLQGWLEAAPQLAAAAAAPRLTRCPPVLRSLLLEGLPNGLGSMLGFLPPMLILLFLLDLLEDSGYLSYAAFLLDRPLRQLGLSGRSLLPLAMGFGCTVPAVLGARGIRNQQERRLVILLVPLMSCSARLPVYGVLAQSFFPACAPLVVLLLYLTGVAAAAAAGWLSNRVAPSEPVFLMELPALRRPSLGNAARQTLRRCGSFFARMLSLVLMMTVGVWALQSITPRLSLAATPEESLLWRLAGLLKPVLAPCGFGTAPAAAALVTGLLAKESIISTLTVLAGEGLEGLFPTPLSAFSFLVFTLLYTPCAAAMGAIRRELDDPHLARAAGAGYLLAAWCVSCIVFQLGSLFG